MIFHFSIINVIQIVFNKKKTWLTDLIRALLWTWGQSFPVTKRWISTSGTASHKTKRQMQELVQNIYTALFEAYCYNWMTWILLLISREMSPHLTGRRGQSSVIFLLYLTSSLYWTCDCVCFFTGLSLWNVVPLPFGGFAFFFSTCRFLISVIQWTSCPLDLC